MNGFQELKTQDGVPSAEALIGIGKERNYYRRGLELGWEVAKRKKLPPKPCLVCGKPVYYTNSTRDRAKYCSKTCKHIAQKGVPNRSKERYCLQMAKLVTIPPKLGEIRTAKGIGLPSSQGARQWQECPQCHIQRWVRIRVERPITTHLCRNCFNTNQRNNRYDRSPFWKGGRRLNHKGYYEVCLDTNDFFYPMINRTGSVLEHRLIMAKSLGRCLQIWEVVHHKNHIKTDNRIENLRLHTMIYHNQITILENKIRDLEQRLLIRGSKRNGKN